MIPVLDTNAWIEKLRELERPGADNILAFYEHRFGAICRDPRLMLAPLDDHLVHRGDGVFETIRFTERKVIHLDAHLRRLANSAAGLSLTLPCPIEEIRDIVLAVAKAGDEPEGNIRILSGRGPGGFGIALKECPQPSLYVAAYRVPVRTDAWYDKGLTAFRSDVPVKPAMFARLKTTNYLSAVFMTLEAMQKHMDVALTFDANGCLTEAAIANVAVVDAKGALVLPEFKNALVGTVATKAMELAKSFMPVEIRPIPQAELDSVREMMILGTAHECIGVTHFEGRPIGDGKTGPVAHKLRKLIREDLLSGGEAFLASLALALGLSDEVQMSTGIHLDTLFVDEGFGSLDSEALNKAYLTLAGLTQGNRLVGVISHVAELKEKIDRQIVVKKDQTGQSRATIIGE